MTLHDLSPRCSIAASSSHSASTVPASAPEQKVVCGEALDVLSVLARGSIDVVVTSPPRAMTSARRGRSGWAEDPDYLAWMDAVAGQIAQVLGDDGAAFLNLASCPDPWQALDVAMQFRRHLVLQNVISWVTSIHVGGVTRGRVRPLKGSKVLNRSHSHVYHFTKRGDLPIDRLAIGVPYADKTNLGRWKSATQDLRCAGNSWFIPHETVTRAAGPGRHAATVPLEVPRRCLRLHGGSGTVLDPFLGSGTTLVAAKELGWRGIGIEVNPTDVEIARRRIAAAQEGP